MNFYELIKDYESVKNKEDEFTFLSRLIRFLQDYIDINIEEIDGDDVSAMTLEEILYVIDYKIQHFHSNNSI
jgi:hypothetical protein